MGETKKCNKCKEEKIVQLFFNNKSSKDGMSSDCKSCRSQYYNKNKDIYKSRAKEWGKNNRDKVYESTNRYNTTVSNAKKYLRNVKHQPLNILLNEVKNIESIKDLREVYEFNEMKYQHIAKSIKKILKIKLIKLGFKTVDEVASNEERTTQAISFRLIHGTHNYKVIKVGGRIFLKNQEPSTQP